MQVWTRVVMSIPAKVGGCPPTFADGIRNEGGC